MDGFDVLVVLVLLSQAAVVVINASLKRRVDALSDLRTGDLTQQTDTHLLAGDAHLRSKNHESRIELLEKHVGRLRKRLGEGE